MSAKWGSRWRDKPCSVTLFCCKLSNSVDYSNMLHNVHKGGCSDDTWWLNECGRCPSLVCVLCLCAPCELEARWQVSRSRESRWVSLKYQTSYHLFTLQNSLHMMSCLERIFCCRHNTASIMSQHLSPTGFFPTLKRALKGTSETGV